MFLETRKRDHGLGDPILTALATATPVAAVGYRQDYGTAQLPGVIGTKWGWSDDRTSLHASASYGEDFSVSAHTFGPAAQLTADVLGAFAHQNPALHRAIDDTATAVHQAVDTVTSSAAPGDVHRAIDDAAWRAHEIVP